jgi:RNA polymerase sigma-70 factor (ECF subfamily)
MSPEPDVQWFLEQVRREQARLRACVRAMGVRADAVDDLAQDALLVAFEKRATFDPAAGADFGAWLRGIARKLVANALRKEGRRQQFLASRVSELLLRADPERRHPVVEAGDADRLDLLGECLERLPEASRRIVRMRYFDEDPPGAIAGRLNRSSNDVRQALFRIRQALLKCVEGRLAGGTA